jgi:PAS domain S-box-containing protein
MNKTVEELHREFNDILNSSHDGIHITDGTGVTLFFNDACERIEGIKKEDIMGKNMKDMVDKGLYSQSVALKVLETGKPTTVIQKVNGIDIMASGTPIYSKGKISKVVINSRDITELNNIRESLILAENEKRVFKAELDILRQEKNLEDKFFTSNIKMKQILTLTLKIALVDSTVLIQGESGVGKGVLSKFIHDNSKRKNEAFIKIDCGAIPENLLESELFGYEKGAFTGADKEGKLGLIELANGGTLFLDEIGELPFNLQAKLLQVIQDRQFYRIGGKKRISVDIRIIAATNKNLEEMVKENTFRKDLFYRLNVIPINVPPLRERKEDIVPFVYKLIQKLNSKYNLNKTVSSEALNILQEYSWPGNIRELENIIERVFVTSLDEVIQPYDIPDNLFDDYLNNDSINISNLSLKKLLDNYEKKILLTAKKQCSNTLEMSEKLEIDRSTIRRKLKKHNISIEF